MRIICPDIEDEELARIVDRIARIELRYESNQLGFPPADREAEPSR